MLSTLLNKLTPNLAVDDVQKGIEYYRDVLGFDLEMRLPEEGNEAIWALLKKGEVGIMLQEKSSFLEEYPHMKGSTNKGGLSFYIHMECVEEYYKQIKERAKVVKPLHTTFYGMKEFAVEDIHGFLLVFAAEA